jgi:hypothetical protein
MGDLLRVIHLRNLGRGAAEGKGPSGSGRG